MRRLIALLMAVAPQRARHALARALGWEIHPTAHLGRSLILARKVVMGPESSIGPFNVIRDLEELRLGEGAVIDSRNWIVGTPLSTVIYPDTGRRDPSLVLGRWAMITVGHEIDVADRVELGDYAVIAGFRSAVLTHSLNLVNDTFVTGKVTLGDYAVLMSGCTMQSGTTIPARSIVSAGSVITTRLKAEQTFYRGNPAEPVRALPDSLGFYRRAGRQHQVARQIEQWAAQL